jgi:hypothetical protein
MFTKLYLETTNPKLPFTDLFKPTIFMNILLSVIFLTVLYEAFANLVSYIFFGKILSTPVNIRLLVFLLLIMFFGFFGRFFHVKEVYKAYHYNMAKTRQHLDTLYIGWIFIS